MVKIPTIEKIKIIKVIIGIIIMKQIMDIKIIMTSERKILITNGKITIIKKEII